MIKVSESHIHGVHRNFKVHELSALCDTGQILMGGGGGLTHPPKFF